MKQLHPILPAFLGIGKHGWGQCNIAEQVVMMNGRFWIEPQLNQDTQLITETRQ